MTDHRRPSGPTPRRPDEDTDPPFEAEPMHHRASDAIDPRTLPCPYAGEHPRMDERLRKLEERDYEAGKRRRADDNRWDSLVEKFSEVQAGIAEINGKIAGYLIAGGLLAAVVAALATVLMQKAIHS